MEIHEFDCEIEPYTALHLTENSDPNGFTPKTRYELTYGVVIFLQRTYFSTSYEVTTPPRFNIVFD